MNKLNYINSIRGTKISTILVPFLFLAQFSFSQNVFPETGTTILDNKLSFKSGLSDGRVRGIWFWSDNDPNHVIYSSASIGISPAGNNAADGLWNSRHRLRFRTTVTQGFLFENNNEIALVDIDAGNGNIKSIGIAHFLGSGNNYFSGNVGIGTVETGTHKLAVEGTIGAREIKVEANGWSDFVFKKDYKLKDLEEVESFIEENKHLPDIPSEREVLENGIQLGEMDAKLLQKIEELTLYMIEMNKEVKALKDENAELKEKVTKLETAE